ncbi:uncharacterized protein [Choristoneura fumiferana]|uniref:uncharacterized protein n=1 Tax=Choristoneura fumiferana TaxID=7141 RepID=UPI003D15BDF5
MMRIESLSLYWNPTATALDDAEIANITPMQYYNWKHYMMTGLDKFSMHHEDFEFLLKPVTCKVKSPHQPLERSARAPLLLDAVLQDSGCNCPEGSSCRLTIYCLLPQDTVEQVL